MNEQLRLSPAGERLIKHFESCLKRTKDGHFKAYYCPAGKLTIGWGHTNDHGRKFDASAVWTQAECDEVFHADMMYFIPMVKRLLKRTATQGAFDAMVSFAYNCGIGALQKSSVLRKFNSGDIQGAARAFALWNKAKVNGVPTVLKGLVRRRASEALMFQGFEDANFDGKADHPAPVEAPEAPEDDVEPMPQQVDPPEPPKSPTQSKSIWTAIGSMFTALFAILSQSFEAVKPYVTDPTVLFCITAILVAGGIFLVHDRNKKLNEEYV